MKLLSLWALLVACGLVLAYQVFTSKDPWLIVFGGFVLFALLREFQKIEDRIERLEWEKDDLKEKSEITYARLNNLTERVVELEGGPDALRQKFLP